MAEANIPEINKENSEESTMAEAEIVDNVMQKFLEKSRSELMYELRRLQHGDRPVTGQGHKEQVDQFFAKRLQVSTSTDGKENVPSNVDSVEEHRPEAVVVEVQGLYEQRRVSQMLQSQNFRRQLENIIRGNVSAAPRRQPTPQPRRHVQQRDSPPAVTQTQRQNSDDSDDSDAEYLSADEEGPSTQTAPVRSRRAPTTDRPSNTSARTTPQRTNTPTPPRHTTPEVDTTDSQPTPINIPWTNILDVQHEDMIQEIRELVHQGIVSATLDGAFRTTLEVNMQSRIPENGAEVAEFIRSIEPSTHIRRNDFSHLGIPTNTADDLSDNISVTSFTAQAVPYQHSNLKLSREMAALKSQMEEMKNMLRLSFELQTDIQRSIRQEVAAAMNAAQGASAMPAAAPTRPLQDDKCVICLDNYSDVVLYKCGHICLCYKCGKDLQHRGLNCPVCRAPIRDIVRAYRCNKQS